ncbi:hypothetical protein [Pseudomonas graminis]|jgi:hypothetical protein|uniref:Uncharacterized protein n=1 Tax=Pseudomonas graminis TaxID=158627 RepID=A0A1H9YC09_9PSED|nr:hypothetical protein [Pseudomonas graminis]SES66050.1 hypothetical protein SAMN05216197_101150 [Pseudomonas graminis]
MAVAVVRLEGEDIPLEHRQSGVTAVFRVKNEEGAVLYFEDEVEAAKSAVELSDAEHS